MLKSKKTKQIMKEFENNKLEHLELAKQVISVYEPCTGCNVEEIVRDNDRRMKAVSYFLYYYQLLEINKKNYKEYSRCDKYDKETVEMIEENIIFNAEKYKDSIIKLEEARS